MSSKNFLTEMVKKEFTKEFESPLFVNYFSKFLLLFHQD